MDRLIVYVDGFNLYHGLHEAAQCRWLWLDLVALAEKLRPRSQLVAVRYFTAPVCGQRDALARQQTYHQALETKYPQRVQIIEGRYQKKPRRCRSCGARWTDYEEKETDVNIAVHLVRDVASNAMDSALVVSADSDLSPAIRVAQLMKPDLFITAAFPPRRKSSELRQLMPRSFEIYESRIRASLLPEVVSEGRRKIRRPAKWDPTGRKR